MENIKRRGRPKSKTEGQNRFPKGTRVAWKSGRSWKTGTALAFGKTREEALSQLGPEYHVRYQTDKDAKGPFHYVAVDTPLFKPGYTVCSIPENHLQLESESWEFKRTVLEQLSKTELFGIVLATAKFAHEKKSKTPKTLQDALHTAAPAAFPKKSKP